MEEKIESDLSKTLTIPAGLQRIFRFRWPIFHFFRSQVNTSILIRTSYLDLKSLKKTFNRGWFCQATRNLNYLLQGLSVLLWIVKRSEQWSNPSRSKCFIRELGNILIHSLLPMHRSRLWKRFFLPYVKFELT